MIGKIAFTGKLRSGKTIAAKYLQYHHGYNRVSFGAALKIYADKLLEGSSSYPSKEVEYGPSCPFTGVRNTRTMKPRKRYVDFGEKMRELDPDIWIRHASSLYEHYADSRSVSGIVCDDLRQPNEFEWLRSKGFVIVRVNASDDIRINRAEALYDDFDISDLTHETESYIDTFDVDYEIDNNGTIEDLERKVDEILSEIKANNQSA